MRRAAIVLTIAFLAAAPAVGRDEQGKAELIALCQRAEKLSAAGKKEEAARAYEQVVARAQAALGKDDIHVASYMMFLAKLYVDLGRDAKAAPLYQRAAEIQEAHLGKN